MGSTHTLHYILTLQEFLKSKDIKYRFINYFDLDNSVKILNTYQNIDFENFVALNNNDITIGFLGYIKNDTTLKTLASRVDDFKLSLVILLIFSRKK